MKHNTVRCPYCGGNAVLRDSTYVYGEKSRWDYPLYVCQHYPSCDSYVGVHPGTAIPKGTLADAGLRKKRILAHQVFDAIWKNGIMSRDSAYRWLAAKFNMDQKQAHIGKFTDYMCDQLILESRKVLQYNHIPLQATG